MKNEFVQDQILPQSAPNEMVEAEMGVRDRKETDEPSSVISHAEESNGTVRQRDREVWGGSDSTLA
jgi:hypothetical protein